MVTTQATNIVLTKDQFALVSFFAVPTPTILEEITCVVETGIPKLLAIWIINAEAHSAANPFIGLSVTNL